MKNQKIVIRNREAAHVRNVAQGQPQKVRPQPAQPAPNQPAPSQTSPSQPAPTAPKLRNEPTSPSTHMQIREATSSPIVSIAPVSRTLAVSGQEKEKDPDPDIKRAPVVEKEIELPEIQFVDDEEDVELDTVAEREVDYEASRQRVPPAPLASSIKDKVPSEYNTNKVKSIPVRKKFSNRGVSSATKFGTNADHYLVVCLMGTPEPDPVTVEMSMHILQKPTFQFVDDAFHSFILPPNYDQSIEDNVIKQGLKAYAVSQADPIEEISLKIDTWLEKYDVSKHPEKTVIVGEGGVYFTALMKSLMENSAELKSLPFWAKKWISLKEEFKVAYNLRETADKFSMDKMLDLSGITPEHERRPNAWDRGYNLAMITSHLLAKGCVFQMYENFD